jgi:glycosyltransferase involved in cell wall biosynthesis
VIAGKPWPPKSYVEKIWILATGDPRIRISARAIPDEDLQLYINAADILAFPFRHVLTSGSVILAMSFGRPVIVPNLGCLPELVGDDAGIAYDPANPEGLVVALQQATESDLASMGAAAARRVNTVSWRSLAQETAKVYGAT